MTHRKCPLCDNAYARVYLEKSRFHILKCNSCSFIYLDYDPDIEQLRKFYSIEYFQAGSDDRGYEDYERCETFLKLNYKKRLRYLKTFSASGKILDVGCGYGYFLECLGPEYEGYGVDISDYAIQVASVERGLNVKQGPLAKGMFPEDYFSLITLWDVLEHLPNPLETFQMLRTMLKPKGVVALTTGDVSSTLARICGKKWHLYNVPEHLSFFSPAHIRTIAEKNGFEIVTMKYVLNYYSLDYVVERLLKTVCNAQRLAHTIPFRPVLAKLVLPINLCDETFAIMRKV